MPSTIGTSSNGNGGKGTISTYYGPYIRLKGVNGHHNVSFRCNEKDLFTVKKANKGNKSLENPIGLITIDEAVYAGGYSQTVNQKYWLYTNQYYWTMSPYNYNIENVYALVFQIGSDGGLGWNSYVATSYGVRPVVNLRSDINLMGSGTTTDPYKIVE